MEKEHKDLINSHFEFLVNNCKADIMLSHLRESIRFSQEEYEELNDIRDKKRQCRELLTYLTNRGPTAFDAIINALIETNQYTVLSKLKPNAVVTDCHIAAQQIEQQRCNKVFIEQQNFYNDASINMVNVTAQEKPLDVVVKLSSNFDYEQMDYQKGNPFYNTTSKKRGFVKIINIDDVAGKKYREGSHIDVRNLVNLFKPMGFVVDVHGAHDNGDNGEFRLTKTNVIRAVHKFVTDTRLIGADIVMLFIMSHGGHHDGKDFIDDCDGGRIYLSELERYFCNDICIHMQNKPKMLFVQACRGQLSDYGVRRRVETDSHVHNAAEANINVTNNIVTNIEYMPTHSDILVAHSTCAGTASHRDTTVGTWFIYLICEVFMNHAHEKDVDAMLKIVYEKLKYERTAEGEMQTGESTQRTFKKCYLNPGIYREDNQIRHF